MKKCSVITGMILASLLLFMNSCEKDYLNAEEISYSLTVSDTVYLNEPVTIKGVEERTKRTSWAGKIS